MSPIEAKLEIIKTLHSVGFKKELIAFTLFRMEECDENLGKALWTGLSATLDDEKEIVENKENVA